MKKNKIKFVCLNYIKLRFKDSQVKDLNQMKINKCHLLVKQWKITNNYLLA